MVPLGPSARRYRNSIRHTNRRSFLANRIGVAARVRPVPGDLIEFTVSLPARSGAPHIPIRLRREAGLQPTGSRPMRRSNRRSPRDDPRPWRTERTEQNGRLPARTCGRTRRSLRSGPSRTLRQGNRVSGAFVGKTLGVSIRTSHPEASRGYPDVRLAGGWVDLGLSCCRRRRRFHRRRSGLFLGLLRRRKARWQQ